MLIELGISDIFCISLSENQPSGQIIAVTDRSLEIFTDFISQPF
jgi:hypothetical protein